MKKNLKVISVLSITTLATALSLAFVARANKAPFVAAEGAKNKIVETINVSNSEVVVLEGTDETLFEVKHDLPSGYELSLNLSIFSDKDMTVAENFSAGVDSLFTVYGTYSVSFMGEYEAWYLSGYDSIVFSGRMIKDKAYDEPYESDPMTPIGDSFDPDVEGELEGYYEFNIYDDLHADDHCMLKVTEITLTYYC